MICPEIKQRGKSIDCTVQTIFGGPAFRVRTLSILGLLLQMLVALIKLLR